LPERLIALKFPHLFLFDQQSFVDEANVMT